MRLFIVALVWLLFLGCARPLVWTKPGSTYDEFTQDRYACAQEAKVPYSGAYVNPYWGTSTSGVQVDTALFNACMEARGWRLGQPPPDSSDRAGVERGVAAIKRGDAAAALRELVPLAQQGHAHAQYNLGLMYVKGQGVPQDFAEARKWFRSAAAQGLGGALYNLGVMSARGDGVPQDDVQAHAWFNLAAQRYPAGQGRDRAVESRDALARKLTPMQRFEAERLARDWDRGGGR